MLTISFSSTFTHRTLAPRDKPACWSAITLHPLCTRKAHTQARVHTHLHTRFPDTTPGCAASVTCDLPQEPSAPRCWNFGKTNTHLGVPGLSLRDAHRPQQTRPCTHKCGDSNGYSLLIPSINKRHRTPGIFLESSRCHSSIRHLAHL